MVKSNDIISDDVAKQLEAELAGMVHDLCRGIIELEKLRWDISHPSPPELSEAFKIRQMKIMEKIAGIKPEHTKRRKHLHIAWTPIQKQIAEMLKNGETGKAIAVQLKCVPSLVTKVKQALERGEDAR
jgi:DNA-binding NarL/FixJ family response regulator